MPKHVSDDIDHCVACTPSGRKAKSASKRKPYTELSTNILRNEK